MFYRSLTPIEQAHVVEAFTFELGKVYEQAIKERELAGAGQRRRRPVRAGRRRTRPARADGQARPTTSAVARAVADRRPTPGPIAGRKIGVIADAGSDLAGVAKLQDTRRDARRHRPGGRACRRRPEAGPHAR